MNRGKMFFGCERSVLACTSVLALALLMLTASPALACTLWSAVGDAAGGGTILVKNRDYSPDSTGSLVLVRPENGHAYLGYHARVKGRERLVAGVNDAGLAVVSATAGSLARQQRDVPSKVKSLLARLLTQTATVDEALAHTDWFAGHSPVIYMLSDGRKSAWVEIGPDGQVATREAAQGALAHTNHFLAPELAAHNVKNGPSSHERLIRITDLLAGQKTFTEADFERFGQDQNAGPDNSIFRKGSTPASTRTMARLVVRTTPGQAPVAAVTNYDDPGRPWSMRLTLDKTFWEQIPVGAMKTLAPE
ncbi:C45 family autoproteolytic acyltransferase/hydolase [Fundidesulfovibrio terrae]|uniref:C45 family autoproteolytic acyltransferase/hydolase n=1 Tax=Fundidesulfovibrio terrae TaxID=2922866 RepID=UPI001FAF1BDF|nr:C45 family peptidase [Fundidesulfovibrio terrae]